MTEEWFREGESMEKAENERKIFQSTGRVARYKKKKKIIQLLKGVERVTKTPGVSQYKKSPASLLGYNSVPFSMAMKVLF